MIELSRPIARKQYYEQNPPIGISTGDIWTNLPTFGALPKRNLSGIVITPACDLTWCKSSVVTYLPIVTVPDLLRLTDAFHSHLKKKIEKAHFDDQISFDSTKLFPAFGVPNRNLLETLYTSAHTTLESDKQRGESLLQLLKAVSHFVFGDQTKPLPKTSSFISRSDFKTEMRKIVRNSFSTDLHFLPEAQLEDDGSGVPAEPAIVLFRYPITIPVPIFRLAEETSHEDWNDSISSKLSFMGIDAQAFPTRPVKVLRLREPFLHDLIARYTALYARLGSPDFSEETIQSFTEQICTP